MSTSQHAMLMHIKAWRRARTSKATYGAVGGGGAVRVHPWYKCPVENNRSQQDRYRNQSHRYTYPSQVSQRACERKQNKQ